MNISDALQTEISTLEARLSALKTVAEYYGNNDPKGGAAKTMRVYKGKTSWSRAKEEELIRMVHDGISYKRIAKTIGHSVSACKQRFGLISGRYNNSSCRLHVRLKDGIVVAA